MQGQTVNSYCEHGLLIIFCDTCHPTLLPAPEYVHLTAGMNVALKISEVKEILEQHTCLNNKPPDCLCLHCHLTKWVAEHGL
jgi:hypothetical protein